MLFSYSGGEKKYILLKRRPSCRSFNPKFSVLTACFLSSSSKGHLSEGYGQLCSIYLKLLRTKMEYHTKVSLSSNSAGPASHPSETTPPPPGCPFSSHLAGLFWFVFRPCWALVAASASLLEAQGLLLWRTGSTTRGRRCHKTFGRLVPRPGIEPVSSALEGRFSTSGPPGKSPLASLNCQVFQVIGQPGFSGNVHTISQLCERKHFIEWPQSVGCDWNVAWDLGPDPLHLLFPILQRENPDSQSVFIR